MLGYVYDDRNYVLHRVKGADDTIAARCDDRDTARFFATAARAFQSHHTLVGLAATVALIRQWATDRNLIEGATSQAQTVKLFEEGGEVAHAVARGDRDALKDGIGDMIVVLTILAAQNGLTVEECVAAAYDEIKDRKGRMVDGIFVRDV